MKSFSYVAVGPDGREVSGLTSAESEVELDAQLERRGYTLKQVAAAKTGAASSARMKTNDLIGFTTQLATMTGSGISVIEALQSIGARLTDAGAREVLEQMVLGLQGGESLSEAMAHHSRSFPAVYRSSVEAGEASGDIEVVLERLAKYMEWMRSMRATTMQALIYPGILVVAISGLIAILLTFVLPRILGLFPEGAADLPTVTKAVIGLSDFLRVHFLWLLLGGLVAGPLAVMSQRNVRGRLFLHGLLLRIPRFGNLVQKIGTSKFAGTAATLQTAGCDIFMTLRIAGAATGNAAMEAAYARSEERVRRGLRLSEALDAEPIVDPLLVQMIAVGERSGRLDGTLSRLSAYYDEEVPRAVKKFLTFLEPAMLVGAGVVVATILLAALLPIFQLYETLG